MPSYQPVEAVLRGLAVLRHISLNPRSNVGDIHQAIGLNKATIVRMIETLTAAGYVTRDEETARYSVTGMALELSAGYDAIQAIKSLSGDILEVLQKRIGWPSDIGIPDGCDMIVAATSRAQGRLFFNRKPGYRAPLLATSLGKAYLAFARQADRARLVTQLAGHSDPWNLPARNGTIDEVIETVRRNGFATIDPHYAAREYDGTVATLAVPIMNGDAAMGALNVMYLREAMQEEEAATRLLPALREACAEIAAKLAPRA